MLLWFSVLWLDVLAAVTMAALKPLPTHRSVEPSSKPTEVTASSWTELKKFAEGDGDIVISLTDNFNSSDYGGRPVAIAARVTIKGNGAVLDAAKKGGLFSMETAGAALALDSMTLANSYITFMVYGGGAIYSSGGSITINRCNFTRNIAHAACGGGAIYTAGLLIIKDSMFIGNQASGNGGGAIYAASGPVVFERTSFVENSADYNGGAIYIASEAKATISECSFKGCTSKGGSGGAISLATSAVVHVNDTVFTSNSAASNGGAMCCGPESTLILNKSTFDTSNTARTGTALFMDSSASVTVHCGKLSHRAVSGDPHYVRACLPPSDDSEAEE